MAWCSDWRNMERKYGESWNYVSRDTNSVLGVMALSLGEMPGPCSDKNTKRKCSSNPTTA